MCGRFRFASHFNPRSPCGERPQHCTLSIHACQISIHAPRVGSDPRPPHRCRGPPNFNPRSPCGERPWLRPWSEPTCRFQSTLPVWGATHGDHASGPVSVQFQSTLPVWGATVSSTVMCKVLPLFQSTLPVWGATIREGKKRESRIYFNPRSPCGERRQCSDIFS